MCGHLFADRYRTLLVDGSSDGYLAETDAVLLTPSKPEAATRGRAKPLRNRVDCKMSKHHRYNQAENNGTFLLHCSQPTCI